MKNGVRVVGLVLCAGLGCSSGAASPDGGGGGDSGQQPDVGIDLSGSDGPVDSMGFEPAPLPYFFGTCYFGSAATPVPTDRGQLPYGLTVLATGLPRTVALEVDANNFYMATSSAILRMPLSAATPETMVTGVAPVVTAIDDQNIYWLDSGTTGQIAILKAPLTATGASPTMLASQPMGTNGRASQFTVGGGFVYFSADNTIWRVPTGGGAVQTVSTTMEPRGIAAATDAIYFTEFSNETIQKLPVTGTLPGTPTFLKMAYAVPNSIVLTGGDLYWSDWFGGLEYTPLAAPTTGKRQGSNCSGGPCEPRLRAGGSGAIWASEPTDCGSIGRVNHDVSELMAGGLASLGGIAGTSAHAYATTTLGELLRFDP
jgi:hypothetical protein